MFKIGDFSKLSRVSVKTLHYYDAVGLLKPLQVDPFTGYRFYSFEQLPRLNRILALKDLGFSLEQIGQILDDDLPPEQLRGMLRLRQAELSEQVVHAQERLRRIETRLQQIEKEGQMSDVEVMIKQVESIKIAAAREIVPKKEQMRERCIALNDDVCDLLAKTGIQSNGMGLALYHDSTPQGIDVEMAMVLQTDSPDQASVGRAAIRQLPAVTVASALYQGSYDAFDAVTQVYVALGQWIESNGYRVTGPSRELYLQTPGKDNPNGVMEIQFPVEKD